MSDHQFIIGPSGERVRSNGSAAGNHFLAHYQQAINDEMKKTNDWIAELRLAGVSAAHPDDGWVNRESSTVEFCYPRFNDGVRVGSLIALGGPDRYRVVRVTEITRRRFSLGKFPATEHTFEKVYSVIRK